MRTVLAAIALLSLSALPAYADHVPDQDATVVSVVDGDTIDVELASGERFRVRIIGIDTPETVDPRRGVQCWGPEASARTRELLQGQTVYLERDTNDTDRFGRLVRYVWLGDELVEHILLRDGYARAYPFRPDTRRADEFAASEAIAREQGLGWWGACTEPPGPSDLDEEAPPAPIDPASPAPPSAPTLPIGQRTGQPVLFDPNGPDRDCGDFRTWAEAQDFYEAAGGPTSDRHRLDADNDGIACETLTGAP